MKLLLLCLLLQDGPVPLKAAWRQGDVVRCESVETLHAIQKTERLEGVVDVERTARTARTFTDTILEVDNAGSPVKVQRSFATCAREEVEGRRLKDRPVKTPLDGRTLVLRRTDTGTALEGAEGIDAKELRLERLRPDPLLASLPKDPVAPGATWKVDGRAFLEELNARGGATTWSEAAIGASFERIEKGVAHIAYRLKLRGKTGRGEEVAMDGAARHGLQVAEARVTGFTLEAAFTVKEEGRPICVGRIVIAQGWTWTKR